MNLEELKAMWQNYDQRLTATRIINEKIIRSMLRGKSESTLAKMRRRCLFMIMLMAVIIWFCVMSIIYNAFDFEYRLQFLPLIIYIIVSATFMVYLIGEYTHTRVELFDESLKEALIKVIALHEKFMSINQKLVLVFITAGFTYLLSALVGVVQKQGIFLALIFFLGGIIINLGILFIARSMGAFKDDHGNKLKNQLKELEDFEEAEQK